MEVMMKRDELAWASDPESLAQHVRENAPALQQTQHPHGEAMESVREDTYKGHHIVVRTSYHIEVDGVTVEGHMGVTNDGQVHYHAVPNLSFASAIDLVKQLIDTFPEDFQPRSGGHEHGEES
jgi:hypothetical protein